MKLLNLNLDMRFPQRYFLTKPNLSRRLWILRRQIYQLKPDFITFQEATDILILGDIKAMLFYPYNFVARGDVRIFGGLAIGYDHTKWTFVYKKFTPFSHQGRFFSKEVADRLLRKGILLAIFDHKNTGERIVLINVHFTANYGQKESEEKRKVLQFQLGQLQNLLEDKKHIGRLQVVAGDFNANFDSPTMRAWLKQSTLRPVFNNNICTICPSLNPLKHPDQQKDMQVDSILCRGECVQIKSRLVFDRPGEFVSDHLGLLVTL